MKIEYLEKDSKYINTIANWFHDWWTNKKETSEIIKEITDSNNVIVNKILLVDNELVGVYQLLKSDNLDYKDNLCWLANIYIKENKRGLGYGSILIKDSIKEAKKQHYPSLYLHSKHVGLYEKYGFKFIEEVNYNGKIKRVFKIDL